MYGVIMSFREREEWGAVVTSCFAEYGMMTMDVGEMLMLRIEGPYINII